MTEHKNVDVVRERYAAFGRGDVPAILDGLTDDVVWYDPGAPVVRTPAATAVGRRSAASSPAPPRRWSSDGFAPTSFLAQRDRIVVLGSLHARVKETGRS